MSGQRYTPIELLAKLVAFDTTSHKTNLPLIDFVRDYLAGHGISSQLVPTPDGEKASLFATIDPQGAGGETGGGIGLSGHTDVVPVTGQSWKSDPFQLVERNGLLYARGSADMKGFLACVLASVPDFKSRALRLPIHILFSYDEEVGCTGVRPMIAEFGKTLATPRLIIVGEPTNMQVVDAHKGPTRYEVEIAGRAAHSSMAHLGANPVMAAGQMIAEICRIEVELKAGRRDERFTPPYSSIQVNLIEGGFAQNVVPASCRFGIDVRTLPGDEAEPIAARLRQFAAERLLPGMRAVAPEADITIALINEVPPFLAGAGSEATSLALRITGQNETHAVSYATEAGLFQTGGAPSIVCGPGDIAQAHTADEFIDPAELDKCMVFMTRLADWAEAV